MSDRISIPAFFVKIRGNKYACVVFTDGVGSDSNCALKVVKSNRFIERRVRTVRIFLALDTGFATNTP